MTNEIKPRIFIRRSPEPQITQMEISGYFARISLRIESRRSPAERRAIALAFFRQIRPFLHYFRSASLTHYDHIPDFRRDDERGVKIARSSDFDSPHGKLGFEIRIRRLEIGWTQRRLAEEAGLCPSHLSEIERGLCSPHKLTLRRIEKSLGISFLKAARC